MGGQRDKCIDRDTRPVLSKARNRSQGAFAFWRKAEGPGEARIRGRIWGRNKAGSIPNCQPFKALDPRAEPQG